MPNSLIGLVGLVTDIRIVFGYVHELVLSSTTPLTVIQRPLLIYRPLHNNNLPLLRHISILASTIAAISTRITHLILEQHSYKKQWYYN